MKSLLTTLILSGVALSNMPSANAQTQVPAPQSSLKSANASIGSPALPPLPRGKSTILGGEIKSVDPVRDELILKVFGQHQVKVLFDERTQIFRDGNKIPLRDLGPSDHASVQTLLDGTAVYAVSIHMLAQSPEGEYQGRVMNFNPETRELNISSVMLREPFKLFVPEGTAVARVGQPEFTLSQPGFSDLVRGSLISVRFQPDKQGRGVASQISVLAIPGSAFVFTGDISVLDLHAGTLVLVDSSDEQSYQISFDSGRLQASKGIHQGDHVTVSAGFDGARYVASAIHVY
jgi:hypothetical protein